MNSFSAKKEYVAPEIRVSDTMTDALMDRVSMDVDENSDHTITDSNQIEANSFNVWDE